jgi:hypothetical protein
MLVTAFYFTYADEFSPAQEQSSFDPNNNAHLNDSPAIKTGTRSPAFSRGQVEAFHG